MAAISDALTSTISIITAMGALGTAAFGLVDASKSAWGGVSRVGFGDIEKVLQPFRTSLDAGSHGWRETLLANWLNGVPKEDQKATAKNLIRLGMSKENAPQLAKAGHVDADALENALCNVEHGLILTPQDTQVIGRLNAMVVIAQAPCFQGYHSAFI